MPENFWENKTLDQLDGTTVKVTTSNHTYIEKLAYGVEYNPDDSVVYSLGIDTYNQGRLKIFTSDSRNGVAHPQLDTRIETVAAVKTPVKQNDEDIKVISYTGPDQLQSGDLVTLKGVETAFPYDGKTNGKGVRIRIGTGPKPVWVDGRNIDTVIRKTTTLRIPTEPGIYVNRFGTLFYLTRGHSWRLLHNGYTHEWLDGHSVDKSVIEASLPLTPVPISKEI